MNARQTAPEASPDELLETRIEAARQELISAPTRPERVIAEERMRFLIALRSSRQIVRMERERGLIGQ